MTLDAFAIGRTFGLFFITAIAELVGCYLPMLWLTGRGSAWLLLPAALSLAAFVWLLTGVGLALTGAAVIALGFK